MGKKVVKIVTRIEPVSQKVNQHEVPGVRVCAYCRVSTDGADQKNSFESQVVGRLTEQGMKQVDHALRINIGLSLVENNEAVEEAKRHI